VIQMMMNKIQQKLEKKKQEISPKSRSISPRFRGEEKMQVPIPKQAFYSQSKCLINEFSSL
jgi:hypothetical protein